MYENIFSSKNISATLSAFLYLLPVCFLNLNQLFMEPNYQSPLQPPQPKNWLDESILVTLFCCLPFGIAGIVFAAQVSSKYVSGDYEGALQASREAAKWTKIGFFIGLGVVVLYIIAIAFFGMSGFWAARNSYGY